MVGLRSQAWPAPVPRGSPPSPCPCLPLNKQSRPSPRPCHRVACHIPASAVLTRTCAGEGVGSPAWGWLEVFAGH
jgi:hypothetical protein